MANKSKIDTDDPSGNPFKNVVFQKQPISRKPHNSRSISFSSALENAYLIIINVT